MGKGTRQTQVDTIIALLESRRGIGDGWVSLPEILALRISQYSARIHTARHELGHNIENRSEWRNGQRHTWFRLTPPREKTITASTSPNAVVEKQSGFGFAPAKG